MGAAPPEDAPAGPSPTGMGSRLHDGGTREAGSGSVRRLPLADDLLVAGRRRSVLMGHHDGPASIQPAWRSRRRPGQPSANHQSLSDRRAPAGRGTADGGSHLFPDPGHGVTRRVLQPHFAVQCYLQTPALLGVMPIVVGVVFAPHGAVLDTSAGRALRIAAGGLASSTVIVAVLVVGVAHVLPKAHLLLPPP